jgi:type II secretory ATPase GspE/PulE/Tfp pilus assembly ATPase PilB-like protein
VFLGGLTLAGVLIFSRAAPAQDQPADGANGAAAAAPTMDEQGWPNYPLPDAKSFGKSNIETGRGHGFYLSVSKLLLVWLLFLVWVKTTDWVGQDCLRVNLNYSIWNPIVFGVFIAAFLVMWLIPMFEIAMPLLLVAYLAPLGTYLIVRNKMVEQHQRVMTPEHIRLLIAGLLGKMGVKVSTEKQAAWQKGAPVNFKASAGCGREGEANLLLARRSPGFVPTKELIAEMLDRRGESVMLEFTQAGVGVRFQIDSVWHNLDPQTREQAALILAVMMTLCGLDANKRTKRQEATMQAEYKGIEYLCRLIVQSAEGTERAVLHVHALKAPIKSFDELGMRAKTQEQLKELTARPAGFVLFAALPGGGLSALFDSVLKNCDRYMRDFASVEEVNHREHDIENLPVTIYNASKGETATAALEKITKTYPNVIVMRTLPDMAAAKMLCDQVAEDRLVLTAIRAKDATEAMLRVLLLKLPPKDFVNAISGVCCVRLVRKLCGECKEAYPAPQEMLAQFGIPPGKVQTLYRPPTQPDAKKVCPNCEGIGYKGRSGLFELLVVDDGVREMLLKSPKLDLVRAAARRSGMKTFQEEGLVLVVKGITSLQELQRALKG